MTNPYESPATERPREAPPPAKKSGILLRALAVLLWLGAVVPWSWFIWLNQRAQRVPFDLQNPDDLLALGVGFLIVVAVPTTTLVLLGLGCWRRSWRLALAGMLVLLGGVLTLTVLVLVEVYL